MQTRDGMQNGMQVRMFVPSMIGLCGMLLLCAGNGAFAKGQDNGQNPNSSTNSNNKMNTRRGDRMKNDGMKNDGMKNDRMKRDNYDSSMNANAVVGDPFGYSTRYMGIDPDTDWRVKMVFAENRNRVHMSTDPVEIDPAPMNYPEAAPGSLDAYHFTDYTHNDISEGSVSDVRERKERIMAAYRHAEERRTREMMRNNGMMNNNMSASRQ